MLINPYQHNDQHCDLPHLIKPLMDFQVIFIAHPNSPDRARSFFNAGELLQLISDIDGMLSTLKLKPKEVYTRIAQYIY